MDALTFKKRALKALSGMYDVLIGAGDPFLASMIFKAMECVAKQPTAEADEEPITDDLFWKAVLLLRLSSRQLRRNPTSLTLWHMPCTRFGSRPMQRRYEGLR